MNAESMVITIIIIIIAIADAVDVEYAISLVVCAAEDADQDHVHLARHSILAFGSEAADNIISVYTGGVHIRPYIFSNLIYILNTNFNCQLIFMFYNGFNIGKGLP